MATAALDAAGAAALRILIEGLVGSEDRLRRLPDDSRATLVATLVHAIGFARAGLADILAGKDTRPAAWTMDILVKDVRDALSAAGVPVPMDPRRDASTAQWLAGKLAAAAGLPAQGQLFKQMQRAQRIERSGGATCPGRPTLVLGKWQVLG